MKVNPYWVTGFIDGEGCFQAFFGCNDYLHVSFKVNQRDDDSIIVRRLKDYFTVGNLYHINNDSRRIYGDKAKVKDVMRYQSKSLKDLKLAIIPHFDKYPLQSKKQKDYKIWRHIIMLADKYYKISMPKQIKNRLKQLCIELKKVRSYPGRKKCGRKRKQNK